MNKFKSFLHKIRYKTITVSEDSNGKAIKTIEKKRSLVPVYIFITLGVFISCYWFLPSAHSIQLDKLGEIISKLFVPSKWSLKTYDAWWNYLFHVAVPEIWRTVEMIFIATVIGTLLAVPFYILAANNIVRSKVTNNVVRVFVNILRTIPTYVLAIIGAIFFGYCETAGVFAVILFTFGIIFKLMYEYVETVDMNPFEVSLSNGATRLQAYSTSIHPQVLPMFLSNFIYTFEINIRASVVLGFVGAGGIGLILSDAMESTNYDKVGAILVPLFVVVFVLQLISSYLRKKIA